MNNNFGKFTVVDNYIGLNKLNIEVNCSVYDSAGLVEVDSSLFSHKTITSDPHAASASTAVHGSNHSTAEMILWDQDYFDTHSVPRFFLMARPTGPVTGNYVDVYFDKKFNTIVIFNSLVYIGVSNNPDTLTQVDLSGTIIQGINKSGTGSADLVSTYLENHNVNLTDDLAKVIPVSMDVLKLNGPGQINSSMEYTETMISGEVNFSTSETQLSTWINLGLVSDLLPGFSGKLPLNYLLPSGKRSLKISKVMFNNPNQASNLLIPVRI